MKDVNIKNIFKITFVIIGTIIGAGFASGQEIYSFFNIYGFNGMIGIYISISIIGYIIYKSFKIIIEKNINSYHEFISEIIPSKFKTNKILCHSINNIINIFLLISFNIMVAGFATYFCQELNIPKIYGAIIISILSYITFINSIDGVIKINTYLIPIIILLICFLGVSKIKVTSFVFISKKSNSIYWIISSILYASYNSIPLIPMLINFREKINKIKEVRLIVGTVIFFITVLSLIIFLLLNTFIEEIKNVEIPIVYIANMINLICKYIYGAGILIAIFTTAIGSGYGFLSNVAKEKRKLKFYAALICLTSIFIGMIGFSKLINLLYPVFGYLGIIQIFFLLIFKTA